MRTQGGAGVVYIFSVTLVWYCLIVHAQVSIFRNNNELF